MANDRYAGDLTPNAGWEMLAKDPKAVLVDVRTQAEWSFVGIPDLDSLGKQPILIEWQLFPDGRQNSGFLDELKESIEDMETPVLFLCRSGGRSKAAAIAAAEAGYAKAYNLQDGFEGPKDEAGHRGHVAGWKAEKQPWKQG